jgi:hypothetical protein
MAAGIIITGADDGGPFPQAPRTAIQEIRHEMGALEIAKGTHRRQSAFVAGMARQEGEKG